MFALLVLAAVVAVVGVLPLLLTTVELVATVVLLGARTVWRKVVSEQSHTA